MTQEFSVITQRNFNFYSKRFQWIMLFVKEYYILWGLTMWGLKGTGAFLNMAMFRNDVMNDVTSQKTAFTSV